MNEPITRGSRRIDFDRAAFDGPGENPRAVPIVFHELFRPTTRVSPEKRREIAIKQTALRVVAGLELRSFRKLADEIGCSKSAIGNAAARMCRRLNIRLSTVSDETRSRLSESRRRRGGGASVLSSSDQMSGRASLELLV